MVKGSRQFFTCTACKKRFTYWVLESNPHPKIKCSFCATEAFPKGEPPAPPTPPPGAAPKDPAKPSSPPSATPAKPSAEAPAK